MQSEVLNAEAPRRQDATTFIKTSSASLRHCVFAFTEKSPWLVAEVEEGELSAAVVRSRLGLVIAGDIGDE